MGGLPLQGSWVRLRVPAAAIDFDGHSIAGFSFMVYGPGDTDVDRIGKKP